MTEESASPPGDESTSTPRSSEDGRAGEDAHGDTRTDCGAESREPSPPTTGADHPAAEPPRRRHSAPTWSPSTGGLFLCVLVAALLAPPATDAVARGRLFYAGQLLVVGGLLYGAVAEWLFRVTGGVDDAEPSSNPGEHELDERAAFVVDALYLAGVVLAVLGLVWIAVETAPPLLGWL